MHIRLLAYGWLFAVEWDMVVLRILHYRFCTGFWLLWSTRNDVNFMLDQAVGVNRSDSHL